MIETTDEKKIISILVIDDDEDDFIIISEYIKNINDYNEYCVEWCPVYTDAINQIRKDRFDIIFIDFLLGTKTGLELIREAVAGHCEKPLILLTGQGDRSIDIGAMQAGATDYMVKSDLSAEKLERCIRYALSRQDFISTIHANSQKFRSIFERSQDCIFIADEDLVFADINPAGCILFGYEKAKLLQTNFYQLLSNQEDPPLIKEKLLAGIGLADAPFELMTKSKEKINCILSISRESDGKGHFYTQGIIHDISALKKSEEAALLTEKLKSAERFALILAHEVRNPVNNIGLSAEQLQLEIVAEKHKTFLSIIIRNTKRINDIVTELLNSSRPTEIALSKTSLQSVLEQTITTAADRITLKLISVQLDYPPEEAWIMADASKLKIALLNIIINAVEAMDKNAGQLYIGIKAEHDHYLLLIKDNGEGISSENLPRLFDPYYTSKIKGMGLGLGATANIIKAHNAFIEVQSTPGIGTTFTVTFKKINHNAIT